MEWVETTGRSLEEAKDAALDQLGVDEADAEFEVLEEPRAGLFGRVRGEARVRARVRPTRPRPKAERRDRRRRGGGGDHAGGAKPGASATVAAGSDDTAAGGGGAPRSAGGGRRRRSRGGGGGERRPRVQDTSEESQAMANDVTVEEQAEIIGGFLSGLADAFGVEGQVEDTKVDDETIELQLAGSDLGLLIGPKGSTFQAIQELARTVVQRKAPGNHNGWVRIDIGGYRQRRKAALERFASDVAADVLATGVQKALEPMNAADRKVVHDTVNAIDGVTTLSEGEEPRRRVVIIPGERPS